MGSLALRPGNSLTVPKTALSVSFTSFVSSTDVTQATGLLTLAPMGLTPTEHASLRWTHCLLLTPSALSTLNLCSDRSTMASMMSMNPAGLLLAFRTRHSLVLENLALRHQIAVLQRSSPS